jgi:hypothetical protein
VWSRTAIFVPEQVALTAPTSPVPTASTEQKHNHDDNQNRFDTHFEVLRRANVQGLSGGLGETVDWPPCVRHVLAWHQTCVIPGLKEFDRSRLEQSVQKRTHLNFTVASMAI